MRLLFWNVGRKTGREDIVAEAVTQYASEFVILAEFGDHADELRLLAALNSPGRRTFTCVTGKLQTRIRVYTSWPSSWVEPLDDTSDWTYSILRITPAIGPSFILVAVHLHSKSNRDAVDQALLATRLAASIRRAEAAEGHERTVLVGDLNMNPFEHGVVASEALHAVMDRSIAERESRTVQCETRPFFYNPMWSRLGDRSVGPPGTMYYANSKPYALFWETFDQVLVRPALLPYFDDSALRVLTRVGELGIVKSDGTPDPNIGSDHFPIVFELTTDR